MSRLQNLNHSQHNIMQTASEICVFQLQRIAFPILFLGLPSLFISSLHLVFPFHFDPFCCYEELCAKICFWIIIIISFKTVNRTISWWGLKYFALAVTLNMTHSQCFCVHCEQNCVVLYGTHHINCNEPTWIFNNNDSLIFGLLFVEWKNDRYITDIFISFWMLQYSCTQYVCAHTFGSMNFNCFYIATV